MPVASGVKLSIQDKLALMLTRAGSQRALAREIGVSHQRVGRWLTIGTVDVWGRPSRVREPRDPELVQAIDKAFADHVEIAQARAHSEGIPFSRAIPVYARRGVLKDGSYSDRVLIDHSFRLRDDLRNAFLRRAHQSRKFVAVSVRSTINLYTYRTRVERPRLRARSQEATYRKIFDLELVKALADMTGEDPDELEQMTAHERDELLADYGLVGEDEGGVELVPVAPKPVYTPKVSMREEWNADEIVEQVEGMLRQRHQPATGERGTAYADAMVLQFDPLRDKRSRELQREREEARKARRREYERNRRAKARADKAR